MGAFREAQAPVLRRRVFERDPEAHGAGRVGVQESAVLVRTHFPADGWLLADHHALQDARIAEAQPPRDARMIRVQGGGAKGRTQLVQVVADLVDGAVLGFREGAGGGVEGVFFEKEADLVARSQEVVIADVGFVAGGAGREFGHGVVGEGEGGEHVLRFLQEGGGGGGVESVGDDEVAIFVVGLELLFRQALAVI